MNRSSGSIEGYMAELRRELRVGSSLRLRILSEIEAHLTEGAERERAYGATPEEAERAAIERFGPPRMIAERFAEDIAGSGARAASGALALVLVGIILIWGVFTSISPSFASELRLAPEEVVRGAQLWALGGAFVAAALAFVLAFRHQRGAAIPRKELQIIVPTTAFAFGALAASVAASTVFPLWRAIRGARGVARLVSGSPAVLDLRMWAIVGTLILIVLAVLVVRAITRLAVLELSARSNGRTEGIGNPLIRSLKTRSTLTLASSVAVLLLLVAPGLALLPGSHRTRAGQDVQQQAAAVSPSKWWAKSPAKHSGDRYALVTRNEGAETQPARDDTTVTGRRLHTNTNVVN